MDYQDNFQDMIARYNRELMRTYQKQQPVAQEATAPQPADPAEPIKAADAMPISRFEVRSESSFSDMPPAADTRPRYPLYNAEAVPLDEPTVPTRPETPAEIPEEPIVLPPIIASDAPASEPSGSGENSPETAFLQVWVTTAREALPIEAAHVTISRRDNGEQVIEYAGLTDASGKTPVIPLSAASRQLSLTPNGNPAPYTTYTIDVFADGYYRVRNEGLPMYGGVRAVQPVGLIPLPEFGVDDDTLVFPESGPSALSESGVSEQ